MKVNSPKLIVINVLLALFVAEIAVRMVGSLLFHTSFFSADRIILQYYPELKPFVEKQIQPKDTAAFRILILGGSVVTNQLCNTEFSLIEKLKKNGKIRKRIEVYNLSRFAHNSWDSRIKMEYLKGYRFDYVLVYHGINDTRANNCPTNVFKADYSHIAFYNEVQTIRRHGELKWFALPYYLDKIWQGIRIKMRWQAVIPREYIVLNSKMLDAYLVKQKDSVGTKGWELFQCINQAPDRVANLDFEPIDGIWLNAGREVKSAAVFKQNYEAIMGMVKQENERLILFSYASYIPANYSLHQFLHGKLDYGEQRLPIELFGLPENVLKGISVHNQIVKAIANTHPDILYRNFDSIVPHNGAYFNDVCHLTPAGCELLSSTIADCIWKN